MDGGRGESESWALRMGFRTDCFLKGWMKYIVLIVPSLS